MRIREGLFVFVAAAAVVAVLVPATALAQGTPPSPPDPPPPPAKPTLTLKLGGKDSKIRVGKHAKLFGTMRPWRPGQQVTMTLFRGDRTVRKEVVPVTRGEGNAGHFGFRTAALVRPGRYLATAQLAGGAAGVRSPKFKLKYPSLHRGSKGKDVKLFNRLLGKQGYVPSKGRKFTGRTGRAVLAYRKVHGMAKTTRATPGIFKTLADGRGAYKLKHPGAGKHVEVNIGRQVMVLAEKGKPRRTYHVSTGKSSTPTVRGHFRFYRRQPGFNSVGMYYSVYFHGGYAIHGYPSVPATYPASHGCVRTPIPDARSIYNWVSLGMSIYTY